MEEHMKNLGERRMHWRRLLVMIAVVAIIAGGAFAGGVRVGAADQTPGGVSDPLVSKSYLDKRLGELSGVMTRVDFSKGSTLQLLSGSTVVIYSGNASVSGSGVGCMDLTLGELTPVGNSLAKYHSYVIAEESTTITASSDVIIFVTGTYSLKSE
ncbi:MAG: hypothetical protein K6C69_02270 [Lachnospiraceae bacterium]|nr:hypothetical protein [Lachnospiraceae bacterium]